MPVLTQTQYKKKLKEKKQEGEFVEKSTEEPSVSHKIKKPKITYRFGYSEISQGEAPNFQAEWLIRGKLHVVKCINGVVTTTDEDEVEFMKGAGYIELPKRRNLMFNKNKDKDKNNEVDKIGKEEKQPKVVKAKKDNKNVNPKKVEAPKEKTSKDYAFEHIDAEASGITSYESTLVIDNVNYKIKCVDGVIKTKESVLANHLMKCEDLVKLK